MPALLMVQANPKAVEAAKRRAVLAGPELCRAARCSRKSVWRFERGVPVSFRLGRRIAAALRVPLEALLVGPGDGAEVGAGGDVARGATTLVVAALGVTGG